MSVSFFEISCDVPDCLMTIAHGPVRPPLLVGAFSEGLGSCGWRMAGRSTTRAAMSVCFMQTL